MSRIISYLPALLFAILVTGCSTTTPVIDTTWDADTVAQINGSATEIDSVFSRNRRTVVSPVHVVADPTTLQLHVDGIDHNVEIPAAEITRIVTTRTDHGLGFRKGFATGGVFGVFLGLLAGEDCSDADFICIDRGTAAFTLGAVGGLVGGLFGAIAGAPKTTIYRFSDGAEIVVRPGGVGYRLRFGR